MRDRNPIRPFRLALQSACLTLALILAHVPLPAASQAAENAGWDQERVTTLAVQLAVATRNLRSQVRTGINPNLRGAQSHRRHRLLDHLRVLQNETRFLAAELEADQGFAETLPIAQRIDRLIDRATVDGRRLFLPEPVQERVDRARELKEQLRPFYRNYETPEEPEG